MCDGFLTSKPRLTIKLDNLSRIHGRGDIILILTLLLGEAYRESRQKRLVEHRKYNCKNAILQYFIDRSANRLHSLGGINLDREHQAGGINLDSLNSRKPTTYVQYLFVRTTNLVRKDDRSFKRRVYMGQALRRTIGVRRIKEMGIKEKEAAKIRRCIPHQSVAVE